MKCFYSFTDMLRQYQKDGWKQLDMKYGFRLIPPPELATGWIEVWGDTTTHWYVDSDIVFHKALVERYYQKERGIQISFFDNMNMSYYQKKDETALSSFGIFVYINNISQTWFTKTLPGCAQRGSSILVLESFLKTADIHLSERMWDEAAIVINGNNPPLPKIGFICKQIKTIDVSAEMFTTCFKNKIIEAVRQLIDYINAHKQSQENQLTARSSEIARKAILILDREYAFPPDVESLSADVGIDKKTMQKAFRQIVGKTVGEYIREKRMEKALSLLEEENLSIEEISSKVGYFSKVNFYKAFKNTFDCTPLEMRNMLKAPGL